MGGRGLNARRRGGGAVLSAWARADGIGEQKDVHNSPGAQGGDNSNPKPNPLRSECSNLYPYNPNKLSYP
jgi:hypothetical protein